MDSAPPRLPPAAYGRRSAVYAEEQPQQEPEPEDTPGSVAIEAASTSAPRKEESLVSPETEVAGLIVENTDAVEQQNRSEVFKRVLKCIALSAGVVIALGGHGIFQERIMSQPYGDDYFGTSAFLVLCNRLVGVAFACTMASVKGESLKSAAPAWKYAIVSVGNVVAAMCQYEALKWVSYPMQLLGKSFKMIPVMMWGMVMSRKRFKISDWMFSGAITIGVIQFMLSGDVSAPNAESGDSMYGVLLLVLFITADSFTSTFQEKLFKDHKTTTYNQMLYVNSFSVLIAFAELVSTRQLMPAFSFCMRHPQVLSDATAISAASVTGQFFIVSMVKEFGALALAATMNVRQLLSIIVSYQLYGHKMIALQGLGLALVFVAMFLRSALAVRAKLASTKCAPKESDVAERDKRKYTVLGKEDVGNDSKDLREGGP